MNQELIDRQISIKEKETELHKETQKLLVDIFERMTSLQKERMGNYQIDEFRCIDRVEVQGFFIDNDGDLVNEFLLFEDMSQVEQKEMIDFILSNHLVN